MQHAQQVAANCRAFDFCALILQLLSCIWGAGTEMARLVHDQHQQNVLVCTSNIKNCLLQEQGYIELAGPISGAVSVAEGSSFCRCREKLVCSSHQQAQESHHHLAR